jgi:hypothetical protein
MTIAYTITPFDEQAYGNWRDQGGSTTIAPDLADTSDSTYAVVPVGKTTSRTLLMWLTDIPYTALDPKSSDGRASKRIKSLTTKLRLYNVEPLPWTSDNYVSHYLYHTTAYARGDSLVYKVNRTAARVATAPCCSKYTDYESTYTYSYDGGEWTIGEVRGTGIRIYARQASDGAYQYPRVVRARVEVDIRSRASASGLTVTGQTAGASPTLTWTYNPNADDDAQKAYLVRVFTQAQTQEAGFDPWGSQDAFNPLSNPSFLVQRLLWPAGPPVKEVQGTGDTSEALIGPLVNGITYIAYLFVAADFNGSNWYSAPVATSPFTMNYEAPPTPTLAVSSIEAACSRRNLLSVTTNLNLLTADDASFEAGTGTWFNVANANIAQSATLANCGGFSLQMTSQASGTMSIATGHYPARAGVAYRALARFRAATTARTSRIEIVWMDTSGNIVAITEGSNVSSSSSWVQSVATATAPAGTARFQLIARVVSAGSSEVHRLDCVSMSTDVSTTTWTTGGLQNNVDAGAGGIIGQGSGGLINIEYLDWHMAPADTKNLAHPNVATSGDAERATNGFYPRAPNTNIVYVDTSGVQLEGDACIRWVTGTGSTLLDIGTPSGQFGTDDPPQYVLPGMPGRTYTLSCYVRTVTGTATVRLEAQPIDSLGATVGSNIDGSNQTGTTNWTRLTVTYTIPTGAAGILGKLNNVNGELTSILLDGIQLEEATAVTSWELPRENITTWRSVRGGLTLRSEPETGVANLVDHEAPPGVLRMYRAWTETIIGDVELISPYTSYRLAQLSIPGQGVWTLKDPQNPRYAMCVCITRIDESIEEQSVVANVLRPRSVDDLGYRPVVIADFVGGQNASVTILVRTDEEWFQLRNMLQRTNPLLLQFPEGGQRWVRVQSRSWPRSFKTVCIDGVIYTRRVVIDLLEVARPAVIA